MMIKNVGGRRKKLDSKTKKKKTPLIWWIGINHMQEQTYFILVGLLPKCRNFFRSLLETTIFINKSLITKVSTCILSLKMKIVLPQFILLQVTYYPLSSDVLCRILISCTLLTASVKSELKLNCIYRKNCLIHTGCSGAWLKPDQPDWSEGHPLKSDILGITTVYFPVSSSSQYIMSLINCFAVVFAASACALAALFVVTIVNSVACVLKCSRKRENRGDEQTYARGTGLSAPTLHPSNGLDPVRRNATNLLWRSGSARRANNNNNKQPAARRLVAERCPNKPVVYSRDPTIDIGAHDHACSAPLVYSTGESKRYCRRIIRTPI
ncbi:hypothetical protein AGLY_009472 [Aphis glycines]|uniref:Uncharacterized protein n=1 Tax=Aphis glycines TaxID=307491 RepID=A0A6G0TJQ5_APHGL|nr:hypothetical protein AGLY_009472 [Aphis glycines]